MPARKYSMKEEIGPEPEGLHSVQKGPGESWTVCRGRASPGCLLSSSLGGEGQVLKLSRELTLAW